MTSPSRVILLFLLALVIGWNTAPAAEPSEPTAHDPRYGQSQLWPADVEKTAYFRQVWPKAPVLVWARADTPASETEPRDPANWLLNGRPAPYAPDANADVHFPEGSVVKLREKTTLIVRHLTVGSGVRIPKALAIRPTGNVWIKEHGKVEEVGAFHGENDVFVRNDNKDFNTREAALANKILFNKAPGASVEILGIVKVHDEVSVMCGTLIIGPRAALVPGNRSVQLVYPDARLVLMSGAKFHKRGNQTWAHDLVVAGELLGGTPDRPLTEDCTVALSWKRQGRGSDDVHRAGHPDDHGLIVRPDGKLRVHSADPDKAHLVITWNGLKSDSSGEPEDLGALDHKRLAEMPRKVCLALQGDISLDGVRFDHVQKGGIKMPDPSIRREWAIAFGQHNEGAPDELFSVLPEPLNPRLQFGAADPPKPYSQQTEIERRNSQDYYK